MLFFGMLGAWALIAGAVTGALTLVFLAASFSAATLGRAQEAD